MDRRVCWPSMASETTSRPSMSTPSTDFQSRQCSLETFEERVVLAGHPLGFVASDLGDITLHLAESVQAQAIQVTTSQAGDQFGLAAVREQYGFNGRGQTVAVIDSGIAWDHLAFDSGFGVGYQVVGGWDFSQGDALPYDSGPAGYHGTHVAGIVGSRAAQNLGVAPGVDLVALRVFDDSGFGKLEWVEQALSWVHDNRFAFANPITTINLSLGGDWNSKNLPSWASLEQQFQRLNEVGVFISVSAGNAFQKYQTPGVSYPAASPWVVPVASSNNQGVLSDFSQRNDRVIVAPGEDIRSAVPDHLFRGTATNRFLTASGTSMAAPYVAGASVLIREALHFMGAENISQETILQRILANADKTFDQITGGWYQQLNLPRALASIMVDDYGNNWNSAHELGALSSRASIEGTITTADDRDAFSFNSTKTGTVTLRFTSSTGMQVGGEVSGSDATWQNNELRLNVRAGENYRFSVASENGAKQRYRIELELVPATAEDLGALRQIERLNQSIQGEKLYRFVATQDGFVSVLNQCLQGQVSIELRDAVTLHTVAHGEQRLDFPARAGQEFLLVVNGQGVADLQMANLVNLLNGDLTIHGTAADDSVVFHTGDQITFSVNGFHYHFSTELVDQIVINGRGGHDRLDLRLSDADERVVVRSNQVLVTADHYKLTGVSFESLTINGTGGQNTALVFGSTGNDVFEVQPGSLSAFIGGSQVQLVKMTTIHSFGGGGRDVIKMLDSMGDDRLSNRVQGVRLSGTDFLITAQEFFRIEVDSQGGANLANLIDTPHNDTIMMNAHQTRIINDHHQLVARGFHRVNIIQQWGGEDQVWLVGSYGNDRLQVAGTGVSMVLADGTTNRIVGFSHVNVDGRGGSDLANFVGQGVGKTLFASRHEVVFRQAATMIRLENVEQVNYHGQDTIGQIVFADFSESDELFLTQESATAKLGNATINARGFDFLSAAARQGETAQFEASLVDYLFMLDGRWQRRR
jgi:subtilisin family serine protease